jgi:hypothetical protein
MTTFLGPPLSDEDEELNNQLSGEVLRTIDPETLRPNSDLVDMFKFESLPEIQRLLEERIHWTLVEQRDVLPGVRPHPPLVSVHTEIERLMPIVKLVNFLAYIYEYLYTCIVDVSTTVEDSFELWGPPGREAPSFVIENIPDDIHYADSDEFFEYVNANVQFEVMQPDQLAMGLQWMDMLQGRLIRWRRALMHWRRQLEANPAYALLYYGPRIRAEDPIETGVYIVTSLDPNVRHLVVVPNDDHPPTYTVYSPQAPAVFTDDRLRGFNLHKATIYFQTPSRVFLSPVDDNSGEEGLIFTRHSVGERDSVPSRMRSMEYRTIDDFYLHFPPAVMRHTFLHDEKLQAFYTWAETKTAVYKSTDDTYVDDFNAWYTKRPRSLLQLSADVYGLPAERRVGMNMRNWSRARHNSTFERM